MVPKLIESTTSWLASTLNKHLLKNQKDCHRLRDSTFARRSQDVKSRNLGPTLWTHNHNQPPCLWTTVFQHFEHKLCVEYGGTGGGFGVGRRFRHDLNGEWAEDSKAARWASRETSQHSNNHHFGGVSSFLCKLQHTSSYKHRTYGTSNTRTQRLMFSLDEIQDFWITWFTLPFCENLLDAFVCLMFRTEQVW